MAPEYSYLCGCGWSDERFASMGKARSTVTCPICGQRARRDFKADLPILRTDPDFCTDDFNKNIADRKQDRPHVRNCALAQTMSRVPGIPKYRGPDGKMYAAFRNKKHRREMLKKTGNEGAE
jgi:hypothetical protein